MYFAYRQNLNSGMDKLSEVVPVLPACCRKIAKLGSFHENNRASQAISDNTIKVSGQLVTVLQRTCKL
jgi:hypothetical protein